MPVVFRFVVEGVDRSCARARTDEPRPTPRAAIRDRNRRFPAPTAEDRFLRVDHRDIGLRFGVQIPPSDHRERLVRVRSRIAVVRRHILKAMRE
jgi:hypothetical protein